MEKYIYIKNKNTKEIIKKINVTNKSERSVSKLFDAVCINLNHKEFEIIIYNN